MDDNTPLQEVRAYVVLTLSASQELDAKALLAEIEDDIGRLTDADSESQVEMSAANVVAVHEERDIYGTDGTHRESPFELLCKVENGLAADNPLREEIALALGSSIDTPHALFHAFVTKEGFKEWRELHTGTTLRLTMKTGAYIWATGAEGDGLPAASDWMLGAYPPPDADGQELEPIWTMSCPLDDGADLRTNYVNFSQAVAAAKATLIAAHGEEP